MRNLALLSFTWLLSPVLVVASASAAIVYMDIPEVEEGFLHFPPDDPTVHSRPFDFNGDGVDDSEFRNTIYSFFVIPSSTTEMIGEAGQDLAHLQAGALIGAIQTASLQWLNTPLGMAFGFNDGGNVVGGTWYGTGEGSLGFRFAGEDGWHYGWMRVHAIGHWGGLFRDYAYETTAGVPIIAGQIPEPSASMMASLALAWGFLRRRRWIPRGARANPRLASARTMLIVEAYVLEKNSEQ